MAIFNWTGKAGNGRFTDSGNWDPLGGPPSSNDDATVDNGDTVTIDQPSVQLQQFTLDNGSLEVPANTSVSMVANAITVGPAGILRAEVHANLNLGDSNVQPLDANHVFTNLQNGTLVDGAYIADGGIIDAAGNDGSGSALDPISTLSAVVSLSGQVDHNNNQISGDVLVNGVPIEQSLTTITPSANGEGNLILKSNQFSFFNNTVEIQGLSSSQPTTWTLADGTRGQGGGLYLDGTAFDGVGLTIDAANSGDPGSKPAFISGTGNIDSPVNMFGTVYAAPTANGQELDFFGPVSGSGQYYINTDPVSGKSAVLEFDRSLKAVGGTNTVTFNDASFTAELRLGMTDLTDDFQATIDNFGPLDSIDLLNVHANSAKFDDVSKVLSLFDAKGNEVASLQFDNSIPNGQAFSVSAFGLLDGGTTIQWSNPDFAPVITGNFTASLAEGTGSSQSSEGALQFHDANAGATYLYSLKIESDSALGTLAVDSGPLVLNTTQSPLGSEFASGGLNPLGLSYKVSDSALDFLQGGETRTDTFYLQLTDFRVNFVNQGGFTHPYTVTLQGTNDAPVIGNVDLPTTELTGFSLAGDANISTTPAPDDFVGHNVYSLVPASSSQPGQVLPPEAGAIWHPIDLSNNFTVHARLFFGPGVFSQFNSGGGDGITFALQDQGANAIGSGAGGGLGIGNSQTLGPIANAVGVKFDTYSNAGEPSDKFANFFATSSFAQFFANGDDETQLATNPDQLAIGNVDDGSWHDLVVTWNATTHALTYTLDGAVTDTVHRDLVNSDFAGASQVYLGFTGANDIVHSQEQVEVVSISNGTQIEKDPNAYSVAVSNLNSGVAAGLITSPDVKVDFSDPDQLDTHTITISPGTVVSAPSSYSGGVLGQWLETGFQDAVNGVNGSVTGHFSVAESDIAFLASGQQLVETFNVSINDGHGGVTSQPITVTINGSTTTTETAPVARDDSYIVPTDSGPTALAVLSNDTDANGDPLTAHPVTGPQHGAILFTLNNALVYRPDAGFHGIDSFTYVANDGVLDSNVATVTVTVDDAPVAAPDSYVVAPNATDAFPGNLLANDTDADGDPLSAKLSTGPTHGTLTQFNADGSFVYEPNANFRGTDSFTYVANDGSLDSKPVTVTLIVDNAPGAADDSYVVAPNERSSITTGVLANDTDADGEPLTARVNSGPTHGTLVLNTSDGTFEYQPSRGFHGTDSFTYVANDGLLDSNVATVTLHVDDAPVANDDSYVVVPDSIAAFPGNLLANDTDADGDPLSAKLAAGPTHGTLVQFSADGSFVYEPNAGFHGTDSFTYVANDGLQDSKPATVTLTVDNAPVAADDSHVVQPNSGPTALAILANDRDADGDLLTTRVLSGPQHGQFSLDINNQLSYMPDLGFHGLDSFTYVANDGLLDSNIATVTVIVDTAAAAATDVYNVAVDQVLTIDASHGVLHNDTDAEHDALTARKVTDPAHGTLQLQTDGSFVYTPFAGYDGPDSFTYIANDGFLDSTPTVVTLHVDAPPVASDHTYAVAPGHMLHVFNPGLLIGATDADGNQLHVVPSVGGTLQLHSNGSFDYTPPAGFHGIAKFNYAVTDGFLQSNPATVTVIVDTAAAAATDVYNVAVDQVLTIDASHGVLHNDTDAEHDALTARKVTDPAHGTLQLQTDGSFVYTPFAGYDGPDSFTYIANDGFLDSTPTVVTLHVDAPPVASDHTYAVAPGHMLHVFNPGLLIGATDADGNQLHVVPSAGGTLQLHSNGSFDYTPPAGFHGIAKFNYAVTDGFLQSNPATVTVIVDTAAAAATDVYNVAVDQVLTIDASHGVLHNDTDAEHDALTARKVTDPAHGTLQLQTDGSFVYTPFAGYDGPDSFTYIANDGFLDSTPTVVTLHVDAPPVASDQTYAVAPGHMLHVFNPGLLIGATDADGNQLHVVPSAGGTLQLHSNGSFDYTPPAGFHGIAKFNYAVTDGFLQSNPATVTVVVDTAPIATDDSFNVPPNGTVSAGAPGVLFNDTDTENDPLTAKLVAGPSHGKLVLASDGDFTYIPTLGFFGTDSFTYVANDGFRDSNVATVSFHVDAPPVLHLGNTQPLAQQEVSEVVSGITLTDADSNGETFTVVVSDTSGRLSVTGTTTGGATVSGSGTTQLTIIGNLGQVNTELGRLSVLEHGFGTDTIDVNVNDGRGGIDDRQITLPINAHPVTTVPVAQQVELGVTTALSGFSLADPDAVSGGETFTVRLSDNDGFLFATGAGVSGAGSTQLTLSGALTQVNDELATLSLQERSLAPDQITVTTTDNRGGSDTHSTGIGVTLPQIGIVDQGHPGVSDTFVFAAHFGTAVVNGFDPGSARHDVIELAHSLFNGATAGENGAAALELVAEHSLQVGHDLYIVTDTHDVIDLRNTNVHSLTTHDFFIT